jgi:TetR/AcrR family transcriptional regulator
MPDEPIDRILDAAYACFSRHGVRRTTMDDIAAAAEMSRPAVYQYVRNKDDAFRRLATKLFHGALERARGAADGEGSLADRLYLVLSAKLELTLKLWQDTPHAAELLDAGTRLSGDLVEEFSSVIHELVSTTVAKASAAGTIALTGTDAGEIADIALALTYGLEGDPTKPDRLRHRLRLGIELLVAGLSGTRAG